MKKCALVSQISGKAYYFDSISIAAAWLGRNYGYANKMNQQKCALTDANTGESFDIVTDPKALEDFAANRTETPIVRRPARVPRRRAQMCCFCRNCFDGCEWAREFKPVPGWKAIPTVTDTGYNHNPIKSYQILYCPKYEEG